MGPIIISGLLTLNKDLTSRHQYKMKTACNIHLRVARSIYTAKRNFVSFERRQNTTVKGVHYDLNKLRIRNLGYIAQNVGYVPSIAQYIVFAQHLVAQHIEFY